ncbi:hypothetical protein BLNAU_7686 [Blattamonas nauphoetae]|uniref:Uncharacterized protein n=1 Tax=Blattamonas nauphoetae TaxID=2049346 RepID=A0ABQ9Y0R7_9EUKA|nr:hypothetical protein BLNAU_7686 [Blattamonas nauphoetae]
MERPTDVVKIRTGLDHFRPTTAHAYAHSPNSQLPSFYHRIYAPRRYHTDPNHFLADPLFLNTIALDATDPVAPSTTKPGHQQLSECRDSTMGWPTETMTQTDDSSSPSRSTAPLHPPLNDELLQTIICQVVERLQAVPSQPPSQPLPQSSDLQMLQPDPREIAQQVPIMPLIVVLPEPLTIEINLISNVIVARVNNLQIPHPIHPVNQYLPTRLTQAHHPHRTADLDVEEDVLESKDITDINTPERIVIDTDLVLVRRMLFRCRQKEALIHVEGRKNYARGS